MQPDKDQELEQELTYFRNQFNELNQQIQLPNSLEPDNMIKLLDGIEPNPKADTHKTHLFKLKPLISLAACFLIVIGSVFAFKTIENQSANMESAELAEAGDMQYNSASPLPQAVKESLENIPNADQNLIEQKAAASGFQSVKPAMEHIDGEAFYADNYTQLRDTVFDLCGGIESYAAEDMAEEATIDDAAFEIESSLYGAKSMPAPASPVMESRGFAAEGFNSDNPIVKTDGNFLYSFVKCNSTNKTPILYIINSSNRQITAKIPMKEDLLEFYISGDRLITISEAADAIPLEKLPDVTIVGATDDYLVKQINQTNAQQDASVLRMDGLVSVQASIYDISDRYAPKIMKTFAQDGINLSSRLKNGTLYLISNYDIYPEFGMFQTPLSHLVPAIYDSDSDSAQLLDANQIIIDPNSNRSSYTVVSSLDVKTGETNVQSVLGGSDGAYIVNDNLYLYNSYNQVLSNSEINETTHILKFSFANKQIQYDAVRTIPGYIQDQSFMSESNGYLQVFAMLNLNSGDLVNNLYIFDSTMKQVGVLENVVKYDTITSMHYMDNMIYLFTQGQINRLLTLDVSNPKKPDLMSEQDVSDFMAEMLYPVEEENLLFALGRDSKNTLKLNVFDVKNSASPAALDSYAFSDAYIDSEALNNPDVFLFDKAHSQIGFPTLYMDSKENVIDSFSILSYNRQNGLTLIKTLQHDTKDISRYLVAENVLYTFSTEKIVGYNMDTLQQLFSIQLT